MRTITFEATSSGDHECGCWAVTPETFRRVRQEMYPDREDLWEPDEYDENDFVEGCYNLYEWHISPIAEWRKEKITVTVIQNENEITITLKKLDKELS